MLGNELKILVEPVKIDLSRAAIFDSLMRPAARGLLLKMFLTENTFARRRIFISSASRHVSVGTLEGEALLENSLLFSKAPKGLT